VAQVDRKGTAAVVLTRGRRRRFVGCRGSGCRWGPRGGVREFRGGSGGVNVGGTMARWWRRGGGGKGLLTRRGAPFIAARGGWQIAARVAAKPWAAERRWPWSECGRHGSTIVRTVWLMSGAHAVLYFS
jgi:hypothetical protein